MEGSLKVILILATAIMTFIEQLLDPWHCGKWFPCTPNYSGAERGLWSQAVLGSNPVPTFTTQNLSFLSLEAWE